jgi:hypothetical protein
MRRLCRPGNRIVNGTQRVDLEVWLLINLKLFVDRDLVEDFSCIKT